GHSPPTNDLQHPVDYGPGRWLERLGPAQFETGGKRPSTRDAVAVKPGANQTATWIGEMYVSLRKRRFISKELADSRNSSTASVILRCACSTVLPWLTTSSSGQSATKHFSER